MVVIGKLGSEGVGESELGSREAEVSFEQEVEGLGEEGSEGGDGRDKREARVQPGGKGKSRGDFVVVGTEGGGGEGRGEGRREGEEGEGGGGRGQDLVLEEGDRGVVGMLEGRW